MASRIEAFFQQMVNKGVRYAYQYKITLPQYLTSGARAGGTNGAPSDFLSFYAQGATLPSRTVAVADVHYQGLKFSLPNNMSYAGTMTVTVNCDPEMNIRNACESWMNLYATLTAGGGGKKTIPSGTDSNVRIDLLNSFLEDPGVDGGAGGAAVQTYTLVGCFPTSIGEANLGQSTTEILTFQLGMQWQYYTLSSDPNMAASIKS